MRLGATLKESLPTFSTAACSPIFCLDFLIRIAEALSKDSLSLDLATPRCSAGKTMRPTTTATRIQTALPSGCVFPARCEKITRRSEAGQVGHRHSKLFTRKIVEPQLPRLPGKLLLRKVEDGDQVLLLVLGPTGLGGRTCPNRTLSETLLSRLKPHQTGLQKRSSLASASSSPSCFQQKPGLCRRSLLRVGYETSFKSSTDSESHESRSTASVKKTRLLSTRPWQVDCEQTSSGRSRQPSHPLPFLGPARTCWNGS